MSAHPEAVRALRSWSPPTPAQATLREHYVTYLLDHYYKPRQMQMRACHPRDLVQLIKDAARYRQTPPALSKDLLDQACQVFLVDV